MAMLSFTFTTNTTTTLLPFTTATTRRRLYTPPISAAKFSSPPPSPPAGGVYQPFRPPPSPLPHKFRSLGPLERLEILRDRLGLWHEYAPLLTALANDGFTPSSIEEVTGITGADQNRLVVAAQVRDSLVAASDPEIIAFFDSTGGADLLYELRFLNAVQRASAAARVVSLNLDAKATQELARAMKDFRLRRGEEGWDRFAGELPGDCVAYMNFRQSRELVSPEERMAMLERAAAAAESEAAKGRVAAEIERASGKGDKVEEEEVRAVAVPVVRLRYGEVAEASSVVVLPSCKAAEGAAGVGAAPAEYGAAGELGVVAAEKGWGRWAVLPGWMPVKEAAADGGAVALEFADGRVLPWSSGGWEEAVLVVINRRQGKTKTKTKTVVKGGGGEGEEEVEEEKVVNGYFVVEAEKGLRVERGMVLAQNGVEETVGRVVLVVRPPRDEDDDMLSDEDWE